MQNFHDSYCGGTEQSAPWPSRGIRETNAHSSSPGPSTRLGPRRIAVRAGQAELAKYTIRPGRFRSQYPDERPRRATGERTSSPSVTPVARGLRGQIEQLRDVTRDARIVLDRCTRRRARFDAYRARPHSPHGFVEHPA